MRPSTILALLIPTLTMSTPAPTPQDATIQPFPKSPSPQQPRPNLALPQSCSGVSMSKVMWWTNGPPSGTATASSDAAIQKQIDTVEAAVKAAGGQVAGKIGIGKMRGLTIVAPTPMLDLVGQLGKELGFQMEVDGVASINSPPK